MRLLNRSVRQGIGDDVIAHLGAERAVAASIGHDVLLAIGRVAHRGGLATGRQTVLPQCLACGDIISADVEVQRRGQEGNVTRRGERATELGTPILSGGSCTGSELL